MILKRIIRKLKRNLLAIGDKRFNRTLKVLGEKDRKNLFEIYDYGELCRFRASSFYTKEPETIGWINSFEPTDSFLDIGANIGIYSLYAATKGCRTLSIEPDALNFALLNLNIKKNKLGKLIKAYPIALHNQAGFSELNLQKMQWGGALSSFDNLQDQFENTFDSDYSQGCFGDTLDNCVHKLMPNVNHIKIDVDGNERLILSGGEKTLSSLTLKSLLIELDTNRKDYNLSRNIVESAGFKLKEKTHSEMFNNSRYSSTYNHIFYR